MELLGLPGSLESTLQPQEAIDALANRSSVEVIAYLTFARSCQQDLQHSNCSSSLSLEEFNAVLTLRNWTDEAVIRELQWTHRKPSYGLQMQELLTQGVSQPHDLDLNTSMIQTPATELISRQRMRGNPEHPYWCTICGIDNPHSYLDSNSWKKHEKEHERVYQCFLDRIVVTLEGANVCELCGSPDPNEAHLSTHNIETCLKARKSPLKFKRRYQLVTHLNNQHAWTDGESLVDKWWKPHPKQAWSCGFCVALFYSITDRLQHIKLQHFDRGQNLLGWNPNNSIKGLLQQPMIKEAWLARLENKDSDTCQNLEWPRSDIPDLQRRLEMGVTTFEAARNLALLLWSHVKIDFESFITASDDPYGSNTFTAHAPPYISDETSRPQNRRNFISPSRLCSDLPGASFPSSRSPNGPASYQSHPLTAQGHWSGDWYGDSGGLATPVSDVSFNARLRPSQSSPGDVADLGAEDVQFDNFIDD